jgi:uncharacterized protein YjbI with pentapeptide repeats
VAITILVRGGIQFNNADMRGIKIPRADISSGVFESTQFQGADLRQVDLRGAWLRNTNFTNAQMAGIHSESVHTWVNSVSLRTAHYRQMERHFVLV